MWWIGANGNTAEGLGLQNMDPLTVVSHWRKLQNTKLLDAELQGADLRQANCESSFMWYANLTGAGLLGSNLKDAVLWNAKLQSVYLMRANNEGEVLRGANLEGVSL